MPTFSYKALDSEGSFVVGEIEAPDKREVARKLERLGYTALDTATAKQPETDRRASSPFSVRSASARSRSICASCRSCCAPG